MATKVPTVADEEAGKTASDFQWEAQANFFTQWTLGYLTPFLTKGARETVTQEDLGRPIEDDTAMVAWKAFDDAWKVELAKAAADKATGKPEKKQYKPSVMSAQFRAVGHCRLASGLSSYFASAALGFVPVLILNILVSHLDGSGYEDLSGNFLLVLAILLLVVPCMASALAIRYDVMQVHNGVRARTAVAVAVYKHSLKLTSAARQGVSSGEVVNLFSNDALKVEMFMKFMGFIFVAPIQIGLCLFLIYGQVGDAMWVGLGFMFFLVPIQGVVFGVIFGSQKAFVKQTDKRVNIMNELLMGIRIVKYYGWENAFKGFVKTLRAKELVILTKMAYVIAIGFSLVLLAAPIIQPILIFSVYTNHMGKELDAATAFTTIALFNLLRFPFAFLPMGLVQYLNCKVSSVRLSAFLLRDTVENYVDEVGGGASGADSSASTAAELMRGDESLQLVIRDGSFSWGKPKALGGPPARGGRGGRGGGGRGGKGGRGGGADKAKAKGKKADGKAFAAVEPTVDEESKTDTPTDTPTDKSIADAEAGMVDVDLSDNLSAKPATDKEVELAVIKSGGDVEAGGEKETALGESQEDKKEGEGEEKEEEEEKKEEEIIALSGVSISVRKGQLVAVIGSVGSGKSSLLSALTGEMQMRDGSVARRGGLTLAFAAQVPWILNRTLRDNITFGRPFDEKKYIEVQKACCLEADIKMLPGGDQCEIGEKGINLSGGQKARVALARAAYAQADVYFLDDPLSAVDAHVGKSLFEDCVQGLLKESTRVLVTHHVHYLKQCDQIIAIDHGKVQAAGTFDELLAQEVQVIVQANEDAQAEGDGDATATKEVVMTDEVVVVTDEVGGTLVTERTKSQEEREDVSDKKKGALVEVEERNTGSVPFEAYKYYCRSGHWRWVFCAIFFMMAGRAMEVYGTFWLSGWAEATLAATDDGGLSNKKVNYYLSIYAVLNISGVLGLCIRSICIANHRLNASSVLHKNLVDSILNAPVSFFDVTPIGRILNRFSADIESMDIQISQSISQLAGSFTNVAGALGAIAGATKGTFILLFIPLAIIYNWVQQQFRRTSTEVERLAKISRSPIFADFSQSLTGAASIRAYGVQDAFLGSAVDGMDRNNSCVVMVQLCFSWLGLRLDALGASCYFFVALLAIFAKDFMDAGWLGLALSFAIELTGFLKHSVRMAAQTEGHMASVERIMTYTTQIEAEAPHFLTDEAQAALNLNPNWPESGKIEIENMVMGYRDGPNVIGKLGPDGRVKGVSLSINAKEKIGIVGRTGSGKSSLMVALFRITELRGGSITIDGQDIAKLGLNTLRSNLSIIPQDPVMFSSTVRFNLDPFDEATDEELWAVLAKVELTEAIKQLEGQLEEQVAEGGENFSVGQRQLVCIARALLRKPRILIMDEATASIDNETDALIQKMIRENFVDVTVLTIAHRLHTIMDSDKILVLDQGAVAEYDTPSNLLAIENGQFKGMVNAASAAGSMTTSASGNHLVGLDEAK